MRGVFGSTEPSGKSITGMLEEAFACLEFVRQSYPEAEMLIGGSIPFYYHYPQAMGSDVEMHDVDASILLSQNNNNELFNIAEHDGCKSIVTENGEMQYIIPLGKVDLHVAQNHMTDANKLQGAVHVNGVYLMSKFQVGEFYKMLNRAKDKTKLQWINGELS